MQKRSGLLFIEVFCFLALKLRRFHAAGKVIFES